MKRALFLITALVLTAIVYARIDRAAIAARLVGVDLVTLGIAIAMFAPLLGLSAVRWQWLVRERGAAKPRRLSFGESLRETLAANAVNLAAPAKLGDFSKAYLAARRRGVNPAEAAGAVMLEKLLDVAALCGLLLVGIRGDFLGHRWLLLLPTGYLAALALLFTLPTSFSRVLAPPPSDAEPATLVRKLWRTLRCLVETVHAWRSRGGALAVAGGLSLVLWTLHLVQVWLLFRAVHAAVPLWQVWTRGPAAILAGLLPLSWWGIGTRDAVLIDLFLPWAPAPAIAAAGALFLLRYLVPGVLGLAFLSDFASTSVTSRVHGITTDQAADQASAPRPAQPPGLSHTPELPASEPYRPSRARRRLPNVPARL